MNGRIYDASLGRFLQADPHIDGSTNTQGFNRYSYLHNNPLNGTDPTGYFSLREWVAPIVAVVGAWLCQGCAIQGYIAVGAAAGAAGAAANGSNIFIGAFTGAVSAVAFYGIGEYFSGFEAANNAQWAGLQNTLADMGVAWDSVGLTARQASAKIALHGLTGGVMSVLQGGKFGHGFMSAGLTQAASSTLGKIDSATKGISLKRAVASGVVGGTVSRLTGGKFSNGALTATFSRVFNDDAHAKRNGFSLDEYLDGFKSRWNSSGPGRLFNRLNRSLTWSIGIGPGAEIKVNCPGVDFSTGGGVALNGVYTPDGSHGELAGNFSLLSLDLDGVLSASLLKLSQTDTFVYNEYNVGTFEANPGSFQIAGGKASVNSSGTAGFALHLGIVRFSAKVDLDKFSRQ